MTLALVEPRPEERLTPLERLEVLCDPGSLRPAAHRGALAAHGRDGASRRRRARRARPRRRTRRSSCFAQDASFAGGSLGEAHAETVVAVLRLAERARVPVIGFVESAGARMQEGLAALAGYGRIFRQHVRSPGRVPQISVDLRRLGRAAAPTRRR